MISYFLLDNGNYIEILWDKDIKGRGDFHLGCKSKKGSRKIGQITYQVASFCLGREDLCLNENNVMYFKKISQQFLPDSDNRNKRCYDVQFYQSFSARFEIEDDRITIYYHPDADKEILIDDVFQFSLSELLRRHSGIIFHGSGISYTNKAIQIIGNSGSGKSTTCLSLLLKGFSLLGDDASLVILKDNQYLAVPMAQEVSVRPSSLPLFAPSHNIPLKKIGDRYFWQKEDPLKKPTPLYAVTFLEIGTGKDTCLKTVAFESFYNHFQNKPPLHGFDKTHFYDCLKDLSSKGVRFIHGRIGISTEAVSDAYMNLIEYPEKDVWTGKGNSPALISIDEGRRLIKDVWEENGASRLDEIIALLAHPDPGISKSASLILTQEPLRHLEPLPWESYSELWNTTNNGSEKIGWCRIDDWSKGGKRLLETGAWPFIEQSIDEWLRTAPILYPFLLYHARENTQLTSIIEKAWRRYLGWKYPPQLMLYLTDKCQLRCPYCYAIEKVSQRKLDMGIDQVDLLLDWAKKCKFAFISLTGGEPTLYPDFSQLMGKIRTRGFPFYFSTNFLFAPSVREDIKNISSLEIHLCDYADYSVPDLNRLKENINWLKTQSFHKVFRYNLWSENKSDWNWVTDMVCQFDHCDFAFAVPFPSTMKMNMFIERDNMNNFAKTIVNFVRYCNNKGLKAIPAKPFPLCAFSEDEALYLLKNGSLRGTCEIGASSCSRNLVIDPNLMVYPCIAIDVSFGRINLECSLEDIQTGLKDKVKCYLANVDYEKCGRCELRDWKLCMAGCLAYYNDKIKRSDT